MPVLVGSTTPLWFKEEVAEPLWMVKLEPSGGGRRCPSDTDKYAQGDSLAGRLMAKNYRSSGHVHRPAQTRLEAEVSVRDRGFCILGKRLLTLVICVPSWNQPSDALSSMT